MRQRDAGQRPGVPGSNPGIGGFGLGEADFRPHADEGVDARVVAFNARQKKLSEFDTGNFFAGQRTGQRSDALHHHSITLGTR